MEARAIYEAIVASAPAGLEKELWELMSASHRGKENRVSRRELIGTIFGVHLAEGENLANNSYDRQIREAIEHLRQTHIILSSSGEGGYWLPETMAEVQTYTAEIVSRARKLEDQARKLEQLAVAAFGPQMGLGI